MTSAVLTYPSSVLPNFTEVRDTCGDFISTLGMRFMQPFWLVEEQLGGCYTRLLPGEYGQCEYKTLEVARRIFTHVYALPLAMLTAVPAAVGQVFIGIGESLKTTYYQHTLGKGPRQNAPFPKKTLHLNACKMPGPLPKLFGGIDTANNLYGQLKSFLKNADADLVLLSEICFSISERLKSDFKHDYSDFYDRMGWQMLGLGNGLMILSRVPFQIKVTPFKQQGYGVHKALFRQYVRMEFGNQIIYFTHLHPRCESIDQQVRGQQMDEIKKSMQDETKPVMLVGDLNIDFFGPEYRENIASKGFSLVDPSQTMPVTSTNAFEIYLNNISEPVKDEGLDYALCRNGDRFENISVKYLDTYKKPPDPNCSKSLTDHKAVVVEQRSSFI